MNQKQVFIYHGNCFDGFTAAWIFSRFVDREAEFSGARYGDAPPDVKGRDVVIADFSYPREVMFRLACEATRLTILDHHHTAREALDGLERQVLVETGREISVVFDMERSGAGITWDALVTNGVYARHQCDDGPACAKGRRPAIVDYIEDRDLWRMSLPRVHEYMATVAATPMTFEAWDELHARGLDGNAQRGSGILDYIRQYGTKALAEAKSFRWFERRSAREIAMGKWAHQFVPSDSGQCGAVIVTKALCGYSAAESCHWMTEPMDVWCVNLPYMNCSDHLTRLLDERGGLFVAGYFRRGDGRWQFSLRSKEDFDVSAVAKQYGGGGHKQAAGFDVANLSEVFGLA